MTAHGLGVEGRPAMTRRVDERFGEPGAPGTVWPDAERILTEAQMYWLTTVRRDGRPHVTPLVGLWDRGSFVFCTGRDEQKAVNLRANGAVAVTTGVNRWAPGTDVVVEGVVERVLDRETLLRLSDGYFLKYGDAWLFEVDADGFGGAVAGPDGGPEGGPGGGPDGGADGGERGIADHADVFRVRPAKVLAFSRFPHSQTAFRPG